MALQITLPPPRLSYNISGKNKTHYFPTKTKTQPMGLALLCPTLKCHIQFSRRSIVSILMCKVLVNCWDYLGALQRQLILRAEDAALQTDSNRVDGKRCSEWDAAYPLRVPTLFNPQKRNAYHLKKKRQRHDWQVDDNFISICYHDIVAENNWLSRGCNTVTASLCQTLCFYTPQSVCLHIHITHTHWRAQARKAKTVWEKFNMPTGCGFS